MTGGAARWNAARAERPQAADRRTTAPATTRRRARDIRRRLRRSRPRARRRSRSSIPELRTPDSPTQTRRRPTVGALRSGTSSGADDEPRQRVRRAEHRRRGSQRMTRVAPEAAEAAFVCELKIDGIAMSITYRDGRFAQAATRGDGSDRRGRHRKRRDGEGGSRATCRGRRERPRPDAGGGEGRGVHAAHAHSRS